MLFSREAARCPNLDPPSHICAQGMRARRSQTWLTQDCCQPTTSPSHNGSGGTGSTIGRGPECDSIHLDEGVWEGQPSTPALTVTIAGHTSFSLLWTWWPHQSFLHWPQPWRFRGHIPFFLGVTYLLTHELRISGQKMLPNRNIRLNIPVPPLPINW